MKNTRLDSKISIPCDLVFRYTSLTFERRRKEWKNIIRNITQCSCENIPRSIREISFYIPGIIGEGRFIRGGIRKDGIGNTSGERTSVSFLSSGGNGKVTEKEEEDYLLLLLVGTNRFGFLDPAKSRHGGGVVANSRNS